MNQMCIELEACNCIQMSAQVGYSAIRGYSTWEKDASTHQGLLWLGLFD